MTAAYAAQGTSASRAVVTTTATHDEPIERELMPGVYVTDFRRPAAAAAAAAANTNATPSHDDDDEWSWSGVTDVAQLEHELRMLDLCVLHLQRSNLELDAACRGERITLPPLPITALHQDEDEDEDDGDEDAGDDDAAAPFVASPPTDDDRLLFAACIAENELTLARKQHEREALVAYLRSLVPHAATAVATAAAGATAQAPSSSQSSSSPPAASSTDETDTGLLL